MKINFFINACLAATALTLSLIIAIASQTLGIMSDIANAERQQHRSLQLANELLQSSEDLTRMARSYVTTNNPNYERYFFEILDIRNGKRQRPQDYFAAYWYLADIGEAPTSASGDATPLQELIRQEGLSERELTLLRQSQLNSDTLVKLEKQAFYAMKGLFDDGSGNFTVSRAPDRDLAISLLFGEHYKIEKTRIMVPLQQFMQELNSRTQVTLENLQFKFRQQIQLILIVLCFALLGVVFATIYMRHNVLQPLKLLSHRANSIARGDYAARCNISVHNELAALGADFNSMAEAINRDISERRQAQLSLQHAKEDTEKAVARLSAYIKTIDQLALVSATDHRGRILHANTRFCETSGYSEQELIGQNHRILNSGVHPKEFFVEMWKTIARGDVWHQEVCNRRKSGELYWVDSVVMPHKDDNGKIDRYISIRTDITARMRRELELREHIKENNCLQAIRLGMESKSLEDVCHIILEHLVAAMQFPQIASVMIEIGGQQFVSERYDKKLTYGLQAQIILGDETLNWLRVFYSEDKPFLLPQEQRLIDIIASDLGRWLVRQQAEQSIMRMATHDTLTGLPNRGLLQDRIAQSLAHHRRSQKQAAVLFIDLDRFKVINDTLGHDVGDLLLQEVATRLIATIRNEDTAARQGGDEFIILLPNITCAQDAEAVAQKILDELIRPFQINSKELHIGGSIGITLFPSDGEDSDTLLKNSDAAMYHAKKLGRNNYQFFASLRQESPG